MIETMIWLQTLMIGVNTMIVVMLAGTTIKWVMTREKERKF